MTSCGIVTTTWASRRLPYHIMIPFCVFKIVVRPNAISFFPIWSHLLKPKRKYSAKINTSRHLFIGLGRRYRIFQSPCNSSGSTVLHSKQDGLNSHSRGFELSRNRRIKTSSSLVYHDDVIRWKHFPRYWPFARGILWSPMNSPHKVQWRGALMFSLISALNKRLSKQSWGW